MAENNDDNGINTEDENGNESKPEMKKTTSFVLSAKGEEAAAQYEDELPASLSPTTEDSFSPEDASSPPSSPQSSPADEPDVMGASTSSSFVDFLADKPEDMTWGRRLALHLMQYEWYYNPERTEENNNMNDNNSTHSLLSDAEDEARARANLQSSIRNAAVEAYPFTVADLGSPSLEKAWAYFEHFTLARFVVTGNNSTGPPAPLPNSKSPEGSPHSVNSSNKNKAEPDFNQKTYDRAKTGEQDVATQLYDPWKTPHRELGDFGLGVGIYFTTLRFLAGAMLLASLLSIPNIVYYAGSEYSDRQPEVPFHLKGSAICTDTSWVPCLDCQWGDFPQHRIANTTTNENSTETLTFVLKNNCDGATVRNGMINLGVLFIVIVGVLILNRVVDRAEIEFDEDEQTAQDYSIVIRNPPKRAHDPKVWKDWFHDNFDGAHVTACTIGLDNDLLVRALVTRREQLRMIEMKVPNGTPLDMLTIANIAAKIEKKRNIFDRFVANWISPGIPEHLTKVVVSTYKIQGMAQQHHDVTNVFITFETEAEQRRVLEALTVGKHSVRTQDKSALGDPERHVFQGRVLHVVEADEPSTIRWQDLNCHSRARIKEQLYTMLVTAIAIVCISLIVRAVNKADVRFSATVIAFFNISFPAFAKALTNMESHASESGMQRSLYLKVALSRWINTAVIVTIIYDFTRILENNQGMVQQVFALFFAEVVGNTVLQLIDTSGHFRRHFLAPRANNQWSMNLYFSGVDWDLSERYTNMTKVLILAVWYNAVFPVGLFLCTLALVINYYSDKFSIMRTWRPVPLLGTRIATFSRKYFFSAAIISMALLSSFWWSGFPFDNICEANEQNSGIAEDQDSSNVFQRQANETQYIGDWEIKIKGSGELASVSVESADSLYVFCRQDFFRYYDDERAFPFVAKNQPEGLEWMTSDQELVTNVWGVISVLVISGVLLRLVSFWFGDWKKYFQGRYEACGEDQNKPFSQEENISGYFPQVSSPVYPHPLLAASIDNNAHLLDWEDHEKPYSFYDLTKDAQVLLRGKNITSHVMFSRVVHYPPPGLEEESVGNEEGSSLCEI